MDNKDPLIEDLVELPRLVSSAWIAEFTRKHKVAILRAWTSGILQPSHLIEMPRGQVAVAFTREEAEIYQRFVRKHG